MHIGVHNNIALTNANGRYKVNTQNKAKSAEKLSTGYRINRAADDAAGLTISEKMRAQIRALNRGTENAEDGVSWVQTGDGALNEVHAILHRMKELTIQSLNDTNTEADRAACQAEFDALQSEIDRICKTTEFNTMPIFDEHEIPYYQCEGNVSWDQSQYHIISGGSNDLVIEYREKAGDALKTVSITVPAGEYTTQELMDEMEDAFIAKGLDKEGIMFEYTQNGTCNLNLEGKEVIEKVGGGLSYLLYDTYTGGGFGALVGTTVFVNEYVELEISNENNTLSFDIESFDGTKTNKSIVIPNGKYTKQKLIDYLNSQLSGTDVTATEYGTGIRLSGADSIVTGFKGNMFKIDEGDKVYHSVFYDNVKYGTINMTAASFKGGAVKPTSLDNEEHWKYVIDTTNNELTFQANGAASPVTLTIPAGEYTVEQIVSKLNELFKANNLELDATLYTSGDFKGIEITSQVKGITSSVGIDSTSSAFNTLFRNRVYNSYGTVSPYKDPYADRNAVVLGEKSFTGTNVPLTITAGVNDKFAMKIDGTSYTITLDAGTYGSAADLAANINAKLADASAPIGYKDKVTATVSSNRVKLVAADGSGIVSLSVAEISGNSGYKDIFVNEKVDYVDHTVTGNGSSTSKPTITLDKIPNPATFDSTNKELEITLDGNKHTVKFQEGSLTHDQIITEIESQIPERTEIKDITFSNVIATGSSSNRNFNVSNSGATNVNHTSYSVQGSSDEIEGEVGIYDNNVPAETPISQTLPPSIEITDACNQLQLTLNGEEKSLTLTNKTYSASELAKEIQSKIDAEFGTEYGGAIVSIDSTGRLVLTSRLNKPGGLEGAGEESTISCDTTTSSLLKKLHTVETAATVRSGSALQSGITITDTNNTFVFNYGDESGSHTVTLTLGEGTYDRSGLVAELNRQLSAGGYDVNASLDGSYLRLTTKDTGDDTFISYNSNNGGTSVEALFGDLTKEAPASATANQDIQDSITIDGTSDQFHMVVNGRSCDLTLDHGTYSRSSFVDMLNKKFQEKNAGITASLSGNRITYTTDKVGSSASFSINYAGGGSSMKAIYGQQTIVHPGVDASFNANGELVLSGTQNGGSISVASKLDSVFLEPVKKVSTTPPKATTGYTSTVHSYIDGVNRTEPITIDKWNNELNFTYYENGSGTPVSITVPEKEYTFAEMQTYLQSAIDGIVGTGKLTVTAAASGIRIEAVGLGNKYYMSGFSGDFYKKVICSCREEQRTLSTSSTNGTQTNDLAYTIGRKNIRDKETLIRKGINDTLSLDFSYGGTTTKLSITLDPGAYSGSSLVQEIQEKLDEQLKAKGLEPGTIEVGIGGVNSGVTGSNDDSALVFKLSQKVKLPAEGEYVIDGVSGNAAFSIFYQTEGELEPAYIGGTKDISGGVTVKPGETDLSFKVDGTSYSVTIPEGTYTAEEMIDKMNEQFSTANIPVIAERYGDNVRIVSKKLGNHTITDVSGGAKEEIFFQENGETGERTGVMIQLSGDRGNSLEIERPIINTSFLKINSVVITKPKYANKALVRLDEALGLVSETRSMFGSMQNRLEHSIANNENTSENTQAAESRIRDTDMALEMLNNSRHSILQQATQSVMAHARLQAEGVIKLLSI